MALNVHEGDEEELDENYLHDLQIHSDESGNFAGYRVEGGKCQPGLWILDHEKSEKSELRYQDIFEFLTQHFR